MPEIYVIFVFGAIVGSFLNVCIYRIPREVSIIFPPSSCTSCGAKIKFYENIPLLSYVFLRGRCSACKEKISPRYFFIELLTALAAAALFCFFKNYYVFAYYFVFISALIVVFFIDLDHKLIFDEITYLFAIAGILGSFFLPEILLSGTNSILFWSVTNLHFCNFLNAVAGATLGAIFFWAIRFFGTLAFKQEAMGLGDVKLAMMIGAFLGPQKAFLSFFIAFFIGAVSAVYLMLFFRKKGKDEIPFGTFMAVGAVLAVFYGDFIIQFYRQYVMI